MTQSSVTLGLGLTWHACNEWLEEREMYICSVRSKCLFCIVWQVT